MRHPDPNPADEVKSRHTEGDTVVDLLLVGYVAFGLAVLGAVGAAVIGMRDSVDRLHERRYRARTGR